MRRRLPGRPRVAHEDRRHSGSATNVTVARMFDRRAFCVSACVSALAACGAGNSRTPSGSPSVTVVVSGQDARACDLTISVDGDAQVEFHPSVRGQFMRQGSTLAIAFTQRDDTPLGPSPIKLNWAADSDRKTAKAISWACYDRLGHPVEDAMASVSATSSAVGQPSSRSERGCQM